MNVGDIRIETITSAKTGEVTTVEHIVTQEMIDAELAKEQNKHKNALKSDISKPRLNMVQIIQELSDNGVIRLTEDTETILAEFKTKKEELHGLDPNECKNMLDTNKLTSNDTTEVFLRKIIFDLAKRIKVLENGGV